MSEAEPLPPLPEWAVPRDPLPRDAADAELMAYGYDPWEIERFLLLSPAERLRRSEYWSRIIVRRRRELGIE